MKIISWNVNGLRACAKKGFMDFLEKEDFDIFCAQETKMQRIQSEFDFSAYSEYWNDAVKKGYSGTLVLSKTKPISVTYGMGIEEHDNEGRIINAEFDKFHLVNIYTPNSKQELLRLPYRMKWEDDFLKHIQGLRKSKPVVVCGDLNVAHKEIDLKNPKTNTKNPGFTPDERAKMTAMLDGGFIDSYRLLYPDNLDAYTWWSNRFGARDRNIGWRIDYFVVSKELKDVVKEAKIYHETLGSDHCPVGLELSF